jgi:Glycosyl transferases group 1
LNRHLHIICAETPWPANSSSAIDTFYQLVALHEQGIKIHLHYYYTDSANHPTELNKYCESIHPYEFDLPKTGIPCKVCASSIKMTETIRNDIYPVLFEGITCTGAIKKIAGSSRKLVARMYNDECRNFDHLATSPGAFIQKINLRRLARRMKKYEDSLPPDCIYAFTAAENADSFRKDHHTTSAHYLPVFSPYTSVKCKTGIGNFCLYHGDLGDPCNEKAVLWLLSKVFNDISTPLVIAGKNPCKQIKKLAEFYNHTCLIINPLQSEIDDLIAKAHINVLPSFSNKRPEFKLVHALLNGRHCITNDNGVIGTDLEEACHVGKNANAFKSLLLQLYHRPFEEEEIELRKKLFSGLNKEKPVNTLISWLFE